MGSHSILVGLLLQAAAVCCLAQEGKTLLQEREEECEAKAASLPADKREQSVFNCVRGYPDDPPASPAPPKKVTRAVDYFIDDFSFEVNSVGGVAPFGTFINPNKASAIKYLRLQVRIFNAVGDVIRSSIGGRTAATLRVTGPITSEEGGYETSWEPVWYNATAECVHIDSVRVEFMNGKVQTFEGANLRKALNPLLPNDCRVNVR